MRQSKQCHRVSAMILALLVLLCAFLAACGSKREGEIGSDAASRKRTRSTGLGTTDEAALAAAGAAASADEAQAVLALVNSTRAESGAGALTWSDSLASCAQVRAQEIVTNFSHTRPNGSDWYTVDSSIMYGENIASGYSSADAVMNAWLNSPEHKANILQADFQTLGVGVYAQDGKWYWTQEFGY